MRSERSDASASATSSSAAAPTRDRWRRGCSGILKYGLLNDVVLNQVLVQFLPADRDSRGNAAFTEAVIIGAQNEGTCWFGPTRWHGECAARISICNWSTTTGDVDRSVAAIERVIERVNAEARL